MKTLELFKNEVLKNMLLIVISTNLGAVTCSTWHDVQESRQETAAIQESLDAFSNSHYMINADNATLDINMLEGSRYQVELLTSPNNDAVKFNFDAETCDIKEFRKMHTITCELDNGLSLSFTYTDMMYDYDFKALEISDNDNVIFFFNQDETK